MILRECMTDNIISTLNKHIEFRVLVRLLSNLWINELRKRVKEYVLELPKVVLCVSPSFSTWSLISGKKDIVGCNNYHTVNVMNKQDIKHNEILSYWVALICQTKGVSVTIGL